MNDESTLIDVPFPPELTVNEILSRRTNERLRSKAPNQFFIYRLAYIKAYKKKTGRNIPMTKISSDISISWSRLPPVVKNAYKDLSEAVENRLEMMRQNDSLTFIHENIPSPPPSSTNNDDIGIWPYPFYLVHDFYSYDFYYYDYYSYYYNY
ncbi:hypothetical protein RclHR1_00610012 [Rhizophagus clarus]|uniref:Kinase-like domain-containing protein n=1 Tax=Rhizophagus clarus TaxID=94130 RepID=A0A2Z6S7I1_9GLOM|nr:hypothetical protein RclHR1_00610012 [Rhizophagus clarus]GES75968.1 kinase-like domain-containing protein [Rhizophagus clarus]